MTPAAASSGTKEGAVAAAAAVPTPEPEAEPDEPETVEDEIIDDDDDPGAVYSSAHSDPMTGKRLRINGPLMKKVGAWVCVVSVSSARC